MERELKEGVIQIDLVTNGNRDQDKTRPEILKYVRTDEGPEKFPLAVVRCGRVAEDAFAKEIDWGTAYN